MIAGRSGSGSTSHGTPSEKLPNAPLPRRLARECLLWHGRRPGLRSHRTPRQGRLHLGERRRRAHERQRSDLAESGGARFGAGIVARSAPGPARACARFGRRFPRRAPPPWNPLPGHPLFLRNPQGGGALWLRGRSERRGRRRPLRLGGNGAGPRAPVRRPSRPAACSARAHGARLARGRHRASADGALQCPAPRRQARRLGAPAVALRLGDDLGQGLHVTRPASRRLQGGLPSGARVHQPTPPTPRASRAPVVACARRRQSSVRSPPNAEHIAGPWAGSPLARWRWARPRGSPASPSRWATRPPKRHRKGYMLCRCRGTCSGISSARTERSSSSFGQWIPTPRPMRRQSPRASGLASRSFGNHSSGTATVRPSSRWTTSSPATTSTLDALGCSGAEILTPFLPEIDAMLNHQ